ncbi:hypothetical protein NEDG_00080 [Nematocida displodere]|uniref:Ubiquitin-like domain-containing protein n=1 Tax=Nematocida displodere TaxID=1805483 RepID=A0A177EI06_9MICR|nr:hypothetical protein NEDG_00080 [Nematocida displodere]
MNVTVKTSKGDNYQIELESEEITVKALKEKLVEKTKASVAQQKLIFLGRLLEDAKVLKDYNLKNGSSIYLVIKSDEKKSPTPQASSQPAPAPAMSAPTMNSAHSSSSNLGAGMGNGMGAGMGNGMNFPFWGGMEGMGGMGGLDTPEKKKEFSLKIKEMMKNPDQMRSIMDACLTMQNVPEEGKKAALQNIDAFSAFAKTNPEQFDVFINQITSGDFPNNLGGMGAGMPSFPAPPQSGSQPAPPATQQGQVPSPGTIMYSMPFNKEEAAVKYAAKLLELESIGYTDKEINLVALVYSDGDVTKALNLLLDWANDQ